MRTGVLTLVVAAVLALPAPALAANVAGTWHLPAGSVADQTWTITAGTGALAGEGHGGPYTWPIEGTLSGSAVQIKTAYRETSYTAYFVGTVAADGKTMDGTWSTGGFPAAQSSSSTWHADLQGTPAPDPTPTPTPTPTAKRPSATSVLCTYVVADAADRCTATVGDAGAAPKPTPSGTVTFASANGGAFALGNTCSLSPAPSSPGVASCAVTFVPQPNQRRTVTAVFGGDAEHDGSSGTVPNSLIPSLCVGPVSSCGATVGFGDTPFFTSTGLSPVSIGCGGEAKLRAAAVEPMTMLCFGKLITGTDGDKKKRSFANPCLKIPCSKEDADWWARQYEIQKRILEQSRDDMERWRKEVIKIDISEGGGPTPPTSSAAARRTFFLPLGSGSARVAAGKHGQLRVRLSSHAKRAMAIVRKLGIPLKLTVTVRTTVTLVPASKNAKRKTIRSTKKLVVPIASATP